MNDRATSLVQLSRDCIQSWGFPGGHLLEGFPYFFSSWGRVKFQVHQNLWKAFNGCVIDCRGAVEDTVNVFSLSLQDLFLFSEQGSSIRSKDGEKPRGLRSVDSFKSITKPLGVMPVRIALNLICFGTEPGVLHREELCLHLAVQVDEASLFRLAEEDTFPPVVHYLDYGIIFLELVLVLTGSHPRGLWGQ